MALPDSINVLGKKYQVTYVDKPSEVDINGRESLWGQIDYWTRTIRIYKNNRQDEDVWHSILHEILHGIVTELKVKSLYGNDRQQHDDLDLIALAIADVLFRNDWMKK